MSLTHIVALSVLLSVPVSVCVSMSSSVNTPLKEILETNGNLFPKCSVRNKNPINLCNYL